MCKRASPSCTLRPPAALPHPAFPVAEARYADLGLQMVEVDGSRCLLRSKPGLGDSGEACGNWFEACEGDGPSCMLASPRLFRFSYRPAPYLHTAVKISASRPRPASPYPFAGSARSSFGSFLRVSLSHEHCISKPATSSALCCKTLHATFAEQRVRDTAPADGSRRRLENDDWRMRRRRRRHLLLCPAALCYFFVVPIVPLL